MRAAFNPKRARFVRSPKRRKKSLRQERGAPGGADFEMVVAALNFVGIEDEFGGIHLGTIDRRAGNFRRRENAGQVLSLQPRLGSLAANVFQMKRLPCNHRKRKRRAKDLSSAIFSVELNHCLNELLDFNHPLSRNL